MNIRFRELVLVLRELLTLIEGVTGGADHIPGYSTIPIINRLQEVLKVPVSIENDVNCAALGEKWNGIGREKENFIMLTLGTGIGGAIFIDRKLYRGHSFSAGEWGNMLIEGKTFEEVASISGLIHLVRNYKGKGNGMGKRFSNCMIKATGSYASS